MSPIEKRESPEIEIRRATSDEAAAIARIHVDSFAATYRTYATTIRSARSGLRGREAHWQAHLAKPSTQTLLAIVDGEPAGFADIGASQDQDVEATRVGQIHSIHVAPRLAGAGIGSRLMAAAEENLALSGFDQATLWVVADNERARFFYRRLGWRPDGKQALERLAVGREEGDLVDVVRYRKILRVKGIEP